MSRIELGTAALTIACVVWAWLHHWRAARRSTSHTNSTSANPRRGNT